MLATVFMNSGGQSIDENLSAFVIAATSQAATDSRTPDLKGQSV
jgi:hypothetical protein